MRCRILWPVLCAAVLLSTSCSDAGEQNDSAEPDIDITNPYETGDYSLPLDPYLVSFDDQHSLVMARGMLIDDCMQEFGFTWETADQEAPDFTRGQLSVEDWITVDQANEFGFDYPDELVRQRGRIGGPEFDFRLEGSGFSDEEGAVLLGGGETPAAQGVPEGGCLGEANRMLDWDDESAVYIGEYPSNLTGEANQRVWADSRVAAVTEEWSSCMSERGHDYVDIWEPPNDSRWGGEGNSEGARRTPAEITTAVDDLECRVEVNFGGTVLAVYHAYEEQLLEDNLTALEEDRESSREITANAIDVLSGATA